MQQPGAKSALPFPKKILYYGLMLGLTLLALEGMARLAYYAAYGQWYGGYRLTLPENYATPPPPNVSAATASPFLIRHPFYGYVRSAPYHIPPETEPRQRRQDTVVIGLLGGSVAYGVQPYLERALRRRFAGNRQTQQPALLNWAAGGVRQPQQAMLVANNLLLGGQVGLIINLDGVNEIGGGADQRERGLFPFFPPLWKSQVGLTAEEILLAGHIGILRREQARLAAIRETSPLRRSAFFGLMNRYRRESNAAQIIQRNHQLAAAQSAYSMEKHGPRSWLEREDETLAAAARLWYRSSLTLARLAAVGGAEYYHFLQPNQYASNSKPLSQEEQDLAYEPEGRIGNLMAKGYPLLSGFGRDLPGQGVNYFDLTGIFAGHPETLYLDACCHLNDRGNELLATAIMRRLEPALLRRGGSSPPEPVSAGNAAPHPADFQVSLQDHGKQLRYVRADCAAADTAPRFFLHLIPQDLADLPPLGQESGFANRVFSFAEIGGRLTQGQCAAQIPLPDYPLAALRTGQFVPGQGDLWSVELIIPAAPDQLRADYAALAAANLVARDYFDLYELDNRLFYLRETCAAADTAAPFFLHITPQEVTDLPKERRRDGFAHGGFDFVRQGGPFDGKCLAAVSLPDYPIKEMRTGQHIPGQDAPLWSVQLIAAPNLDQLRADYAALSAANPVVRDYFDLYWQGNRLLYLRETCAAADMAAGFFLHIVPEDVTDLPKERRPAGFAHSGFEFVRQGGPFEGMCLASVPLPDYPIKEMRTGQHIPGQGDLWSVVIAGP